MRDKDQYGLLAHHLMQLGQQREALCRIELGEDPFNALIRHVWSGAWAPKGANWGHHGNPAMDKLIEGILAEFDTTKRLALLTQLHEMMSEEAVLIFVAHDLNPRAMSPKVKGFVQAQSWFQDLTPVTLAP